MIPKFIKQDSIEDFTFHPDRPTHSPGSTQMWVGAARATYGHADFYLALRHRGGDAETADSLKPHLYVHHVVINGKTMDPQWHLLFTHEGVWYHSDGWFENQNTVPALEDHPLIKNRDDWRDGVEVLTLDQQRTLMDLGFTYLGEMGSLDPAKLDAGIVSIDEDEAVDHGPDDPDPSGMAWPLRP